MRKDLTIDEIFEEELDGFQEEFYAGNRLAILPAILRSCTSGVALPPFLVEEVRTAVYKRLHHETLTLDEALGIERPKGENTARLRRWFAPDPGTGVSLMFRVMVRIDHLTQKEKDKGRSPKKTVIHKEVACEFKISVGTLRAIVKEAEEIKRRISQDIE